MLLAEADSPIGFDDRYVAEPKMDGWRMVADVTDGYARLRTRNGTPVHVPSIAAALAQLPVSCVLDGELVYLDDEGISRLPQLIGQTGHVAYYVFDVLSVEEDDVTPMAYHVRRKLLEAFLGYAGSPVYLIPQVPGPQAAELFDVFVAAGGEGIVLKDRTSKYYPGRRMSCWRKVKP